MPNSKFVCCPTSLDVAQGPRNKPELLVSDASRAHEVVTIEVIQEGSREQITDVVTSEEPLEIRLCFGPAAQRSELTIAVTMRTPGKDAELAIGFLFSEGVIRTADDLDNIEHCGPPSPDKGLHNVIKVELAAGVVFDPTRLERNFYTSSSCGVCGKTSIAAVLAQLPEPARVPSTFRISADVLVTLPAELRNGQDEFLRTGGLHASATFDADGRIDRIREDVGRHNALDKLVGSQLTSGGVSLASHGLILSGRASFELVQKAAMAHCPFIAAVGPPSSLAVEFAREQGITLVGFLTAKRFNIYSHSQRIVGA